MFTTRSVRLKELLVQKLTERVWKSGSFSDEIRAKSSKTRSITDQLKSGKGVGHATGSGPHRLQSTYRCAKPNGSMQTTPCGIIQWMKFSILALRICFVAQVRHWYWRCEVCLSVGATDRAHSLLGVDILRFGFKKKMLFGTHRTCKNAL